MLDEAKVTTEQLMNSKREGFRNGVDGIVRDIELLHSRKPWDVDLDSVVLLSGVDVWTQHPDTLNQIRDEWSESGKEQEEKQEGYESAKGDAGGMKDVGFDRPQADDDDDEDGGFSSLFGGSNDDGDISTGRFYDVDGWTTISEWGAVNAEHVDDTYGDMLYVARFKEIMRQLVDQTSPEEHIKTSHDQFVEELRSIRYERVQDFGKMLARAEGSWDIAYENPYDVEVPEWPDAPSVYDMEVDERGQAEEDDDLMEEELEDSAEMGFDEDEDEEDDDGIDAERTKPKAGWMARWFK